MNLLLTCEDVLRFIPDYQENVLSSGLRLRFSLHLKACKPCRVMLESLQVIPQIFRKAISEDGTTPSLEARSALKAVLARLQTGGRLATAASTHRDGPLARCSAHPIPLFVEQAVAEGTADLPLRLMAQAYTAIREHGGALAEQPFLPESVLEELPPFEKWRWTKTLLNGCGSAMLTRDSNTGASLHMIRIPPGQYFPDHKHQGDEHMLFLSGRAEDSLIYGGAGDWIHQASGTDHRSFHGRGTEVCWALGRLEGSGVRFSGWRGTLQELAERLS